MRHSSLRQEYTPSGAEITIQSPSASLMKESLVVIDPTLTNVSHLVQGVHPATSILILQPQQDSIAQISQYLAQHPKITRLHLLSHGKPGQVQLGATSLTSENLAHYTAQLYPWQIEEILLYGCRVAETAQGRNFVKSFAKITGAKIAASSTVVGNAALGGNWQLDYQTEPTTTPLPFLAEVLDHYQGVFIDIADGDIENLITALENGENEINLAPGGTYNLTSAYNSSDNGLPTITGNITINGNRASISGDSSLPAEDQFRLFYVQSGGQLTLNDLTLSQGRAVENGGAILNEGTLTVNRSTLTGNEVGRSGSGIANLGTTTINNSTIYENTHTSDANEVIGGAVYNEGTGSTLVINSSTLSDNRGANIGGGILNLNGNTTVNNSTITLNKARNEGGGLYQRDAGTFTLKNSIILGNSASGIPDNADFASFPSSFTSNGNNLIGLGQNNRIPIQETDQKLDAITIDNILNQTLDLNGLPEGSPQTHALVEGSEAIDAGSPEAAPDQRGAFAVDTPDIGAYEFGADADVEVRDNENNLITDNDGTVDFGEIQETENEVISRTFTIVNEGEFFLNISDRTIPDGFSLVGDFPTQIPGTDNPDAPNSETFTLEFDGDGLTSEFNDEGIANISEVFSFETNDSNINGVEGDSTYNFNLSATITKEVEEKDDIENGGETDDDDLDNGSGTGGDDQPVVDRIADILTFNESNNFFFFGKQGGNNLQFKLIGENSSQITQIKIKFQNVNGIETGSEILFSTLPRQFRPNGFAFGQQQRIINVSQQQSFTLELENAQGQTLSQFFNTTEISEGSYSVNFGQGIQLEFQQTTSNPPLGVGNAQNSGLEVFDLTRTSETVQGTFTLYREAKFDNVVGLYRLDNSEGAVNGLNPGDDGYAEAAMTNRLTDINLSVSNQSSFSLKSSITGGALYAPFIITNGSIEEFLDENPENSAGSELQAYFPFMSANPDKADHLRLLGNNLIGFEDLPGGGDLDFNDMIVDVTLTV
ncbi:DUF4347 domain-containing protein [Spirulina sp. CS-785/01]|uniref:DUF4347 domain-containing protein n=1 Tax=Spirulina sp. CS-785/01 TaxID=3021716 RepID=UPI00232D35E9|nr:DUF4347 domain-containing protein [Spirulina sp. CS-785/01]MDB9312478.1 DUF4347 domain-containing protein [Spirulina sp. CS-785/01]